MIIKSLFSKKYKEEKNIKLPEDVFLSPGYVYYKNDDEYVKNGIYKVFTLYINLYMEESDDDFCYLCDGIINELLKCRRIIISINPVNKNEETHKNLLDELILLKNKNIYYDDFIVENGEGYLILCNEFELPFKLKWVEEFLYDWNYEVYGYKSESEILDKEKICQIIDEHKYDIYLYYYKYPDYLEIKIKNSFNLCDLTDIIKLVCKESKRRFFVEY